LKPGFQRRSDPKSFDLAAIISHKKEGQGADLLDFKPWKEEDRKVGRTDLTVVRAPSSFRKKKRRRIGLEKGIEERRRRARERWFHREGQNGKRSRKGVILSRSEPVNLLSEFVTKKQVKKEEGGEGEGGRAQEGGQDSGSTPSKSERIVHQERCGEREKDERIDRGVGVSKQKKVKTKKKSVKGGKGARRGGVSSMKDDRKNKKRV